MAVAMLYPDQAKGGRGHRNPSEIEGFGAAYLTYARTVLRDARELAEAVLASHEGPCSSSGCSGREPGHLSCAGWEEPPARMQAHVPMPIAPHRP